MSASKGFSDWTKGGMRYVNLRRRLQDSLAPAEVQAFFIGVTHRPATIYPLIFAPLFLHEYAIALTSEGISVFRLRLPGVFSWAIDEMVYAADINTAQLERQKKKVVVNGVAYYPFPFQSKDAEQLLSMFEDR